MGFGCHKFTVLYQRSKRLWGERHSPPPFLGLDGLDSEAAAGVLVSSNRFALYQADLLKGLVNSHRARGEVDVGPLQGTHLLWVGLIEQLRPGEEIIITRDQKPVARLVGEPQRSQSLRQLGTLKGTVRCMAPDFDAPLEDFKEYME